MGYLKTPSTLETTLVLIELFYVQLILEFFNLHFPDISENRHESSQVPLVSPKNELETATYTINIFITHVHHNFESRWPRRSLSNSFPFK